jgi:hypothetical protein
MDEGDTIRRGEAVAGLTLLGGMMLALVGTFVYRIAMQKTPAPHPSAEQAIAAQPIDAPAQPAAEAAVKSEVVESTPNAPSAVEPISAHADENPNAVPLVSGQSEAPPFQPATPPAPSATDNRPHFVAPASHPNQ